MNQTEKEKGILKYILQKFKDEKLPNTEDFTEFNSLHSKIKEL